MWKTLDIQNPRIIEKTNGLSPMSKLQPTLISLIGNLRVLTEEPSSFAMASADRCAGIPHAGICEGAVRQRAVLP